MEVDKSNYANTIFSTSIRESEYFVFNPIRVDVNSQEDIEQKQPRSSGKVLQTCKKFGEETSMHGLKNVVNPKSRWWKRLLWSLLLLGSAAFASRNLYLTVDEYLKFPISTTTSLVHKKEATLPAVTICNLNPYRASKVSLFLANAYFHLINQPQGEELFRLVIDTCKNLRNDPVSLCRKLPLDIRHQLHEMLVMCQINSLICSSLNFKFLSHREYGACFVLNVTSLNNTRVFKAGIGSGLHLELNIQHEEYLPFTKEVGLKVLIHPPDTMPFPYENGISVSTGVVTNIAIRKVRVHRLGYPWGDCIQPKDTNDNLNAYNKYGFGYSQGACYKTCHQQTVIQKCKCCDSNIPCPANTQNITLPAHKICNESNVTIAICMSNTRHEFSSGIHLPCFEKCSPPCEQIIYRTSYSIASLPDDFKRYPFINIPNASQVFKLRDNLNIVKLRIYFETLQEELIVSSPAYTWFKLVSDIGGTLGLWLGFSVLTAVEFLELGCDVIGRTLSCLRGEVKK